jgi:hypothetical protein
MTDTLFIIAAVALILSIILIFALLSTRPKEPEWKAKVKNRLRVIDQKVSSGDSTSLINALVEVDKLLDHTLKNNGVAGTTMGDRLKNAKNKFEWQAYNNIWIAHKARNSLVHDLDVKHSTKQIANYISTLKTAIRDLL